MVRELKHATSERLLRHIMATVGNGDVGADSVAAEGSKVDEDDAEAKREALLNAPSEDGSDEEEAALKREAPVNCGHIVTWGVPISVEAVCRMRLKPRTHSAHASAYSPPPPPSSRLGAGDPKDDAGRAAGRGDQRGHGA